VVHAACEVIIAASTAESPKLLMLSGIGPADYLHAMGVIVRHDLAGVGEEFQDHVSAMFAFEPAVMYRCHPSKTMRRSSIALSRPGSEPIWRPCSSQDHRTGLVSQ
jgi:choline dehydrogenase-like flavoprotein